MNMADYGGFLQPMPVTDGLCGHCRLRIVNLPRLEEIAVIDGWFLFACHLCFDDNMDLSFASGCLSLRACFWKCGCGIGFVYA